MLPYRLMMLISMNPLVNQVHICLFKHFLMLDFLTVLLTINIIEIPFFVTITFSAFLFFLALDSSGRPRFKLRHSHLQWFLASYLTLLSFSVFIYRMVSLFITLQGFLGVEF